MPSVIGPSSDAPFLIIGCANGSTVNIGGGGGGGAWSNMHCTVGGDVYEFTLTEYCAIEDCSAVYPDPGEGTGEGTGTVEGTVEIAEVQWLTFEEANTVLGQGILPVLLVAALFAMALRMFNL